MAEVRHLWVLPGWGGTTLYHVPPQREISYRNQPRRVWLDTNGLLNGSVLRYLRLPPPEGVNIQPGELLRSADGPITRYINTVALGWPDGMDHPWPYDWRRPIRDLGTELAGAIGAWGGGGGSHYLVGHSMGGCVALAAWAVLKSRGQEGLIRRIVTLASPVLGCYAAPRTWAGYEGALNMLACLRSCITFAGTYFGGGPVMPPRAAMQELGGIFASWPSTYDLLPDPNLEDDPLDVNRSACYAPEPWAQAFAPPRAPLLNASLTNYHAWIRTPANRPPRGVLFHVYCNGRPTPWRMTQPRFRSYREFQVRNFPSFGAEVAFVQSFLPGFTLTGEGDGVATVAQQAYPGYACAEIRCEHQAAPFDARVRQYINNWLQDTIPPAETPPQVLPLPAQNPQITRGGRSTPPRTAIADATEEPAPPAPESPRPVYEGAAAVRPAPAQAGEDRPMYDDNRKLFRDRRPAEPAEGH